MARLGISIASILAIALVACSSTAPKVGDPRQPASARLELSKGPPQAAPAYLQTFTDPEFGSKVTRITGDPGTPIPGIPGAAWPTRNRHRYSTLPVWSADGSLLFLELANGLLLDGRTYEPIKFLQTRGTRPLWHPKLPDIMIETDNNKINFLNARTDERTTKIWRDDYSEFHFNTRTAPSYDGRFVGVTARRESDGQIVCIVFDLESGAKSNEIVFYDWGYSGEDSTHTNAYRCSPSASGAFIHVDGWAEKRNNNNRFFDWHGRLISEVLNRIECPGHGDLCITAAGEDMLVGVCKDPAQGRGTVGFLVAKGLPVKPILTTRGAAHTSCRNSAAPGWAYGSDTGAGGEIWRVRLDDIYDGRAPIERIAHVHDANNCGYYCEPQAVPSPDGRKVLWAGNWDGTLQGVHSFVAEVAPGLTPISNQSE